MTPEETTAIEREWEERLNVIKITFLKIQQKKQKQGVIDCPQCGKKLQYSISSYNGHIWMKCETQGCLNMMQ